MIENHYGHRGSQRRAMLVDLPQRRYPVSFFLGELLILAHRGTLLPGRIWMLLVTQLAHLFHRALHLLCESATESACDR